MTSSQNPGPPVQSPPAASPLPRRVLAERIARARMILSGCTLCPRRCGVDRLGGQTGVCRAPAQAVVCSHEPHFGEEPPLVGRGGSGTIFFSHCNLRCVFCQNWPIAHQGQGRAVSDAQLAAMMLDLQARGCHNVNLVTPTPFLPAILAAFRLARDKGLRIPLCYNTSGYEEPGILGLLDGIVDIYLPDMKTTDPAVARRLFDAPDYPEKAFSSLRVMHRQVGDLVTDARGIAVRGLLIRHLVLPGGQAGTPDLVSWVVRHLSPDTVVNIMDQYRPEHRAREHPSIARRITPEEYAEARGQARSAGLRRLLPGAGP